MNIPYDMYMELMYPSVKCEKVDTSVSAALLNNRLYDWRQLFYGPLQTKKDKDSHDTLLVVRTPSVKINIDSGPPTTSYEFKYEEAPVEISTNRGDVAQ